MESEDIILRQTTNYQLCQWDSEDFIRRTDFNADNAKIDAALLAQTEALAAEAQTREEKNLRVLLKNVQQGIASQALILDVEDLDFSPYLWVELVVETETGAVPMRLKPDNTGDFQACQLGGTPFSCDCTAYGEPDGSGMGGMYVRMWSYPGSERTHFLSTRINEEGFSALHAVYLKPINAIKDLGIWSFESGGIPSGTRARLYGVKR